jgi:hypothetical protein
MMLRELSPIRTRPACYRFFMTLGNIGRREFVALLSAATAAQSLPWSMPAQAQRRDSMRRIAVLFPGAAEDQDGQSRLSAFLQGLQQLGWTDGRDVRIDYRWGGGLLTAFANTRLSWSRSHRRSS